MQQLPTQLITANFTSSRQSSTPTGQISLKRIESEMLSNKRLLL